MQHLSAEPTPCQFEVVRDLTEAISSRIEAQETL
jgi:hypothetical protein